MKHESKLDKEAWQKSVFKGTKNMYDTPNTSQKYNVLYH